MNALESLYTEVSHRRYTKSGVFRTRLSAAQIALLERAGHGGIITLTEVTNWLSLRSMVDKGAVEIVSQEVRRLTNGLVVNGKITAVRVK